MKNAINWFEIPAKNFNRAKKFYETVLGITMNPMEGQENYALFCSAMDGSVGGGLTAAKDAEPSTKGSLVYLNADPDLSIALNRVEKAGGKVLMPKTSIGPNGFIAKFTDTEGNLIAFHSMK